MMNAMRSMFVLCGLVALTVGCQTSMIGWGEGPSVYGLRTQVIDAGRSQFVEQLSLMNTDARAFWERLAQLGASPEEISVSQEDPFVVQPYLYVQLFTDATITDAVSRAQAFLPKGEWWLIRRSLPFEAAVSPGAYAAVYGKGSKRVAVHIFTPHGRMPADTQRRAIVLKTIGLKRRQWESAFREMGILDRCGNWGHPFAIEQP